MNDMYVHTSRLESDYLSMQQLQGPVITWQGSPAGDPARRLYPSVYKVIYNILAPTVNGEMQQHIVQIDCSASDYPRRPPAAMFLTPVLMHPHCYDNSKICLGGFPLEETLAGLCVRLAGFFLYDPHLINPRSPASSNFYAWYQSNRKRLPLQHIILPQIDDISSSSGEIFVVKRRTASLPQIEQSPVNITIKGRRNSEGM